MVFKNQPQHTVYTTVGRSAENTMHGQPRKVKKSFSISLESEAFLKRMRKEHKAPSESETLDLLLRELMATHKQRAIESAIVDYYDSLSDEDVEEQRAWGVFAEAQLTEGVR
jgi:hypothetical protein